MKTWGMMLAVVAACGLFVVGCDKKDDKKKDGDANGGGDNDMSFNAFKAWSNYAVGASTTYKRAAGGRTKKTIKSKTAELIVLTVQNLKKDGDKWVDNGDATTQDVKPAPKPDLTKECTQCKKAASTHAKPTYEKGKGEVGGKEVEVITMTYKNCKTDAEGKMKFTMAIPGGAMGDYAIKQVVDFDAKK